MEKRIVHSILLLVIYVTTLIACFEPEEGCLDFQASNFSLAADRACSDAASASCACTYPSISIRIKQIFNDSTFVTNRIYQTNDGQYIRIQDIQFYISDIQLTTAEGQVVPTLDTITLFLLNDNNQFQFIEILDDFRIITSNETTQELITSNISGTFTGLQFSVGIKSPANTADPDSINRLPPHDLLIDSLYLGAQGFVFNRIAVQPDTQSTETLLIQLTDQDSLPRISLDNFVVTKEPGRDISIDTLQINHANWFDGINFVEDTEEEIRRKIVTNTANVFSIIP